MADKTFWFPSQSGSYNLPTGKTLQIKIYYSNASTVNVDTDTLLEDLDRLEFPFEIAADKNFRLARWKFSFLNIDDVFENEDIILNSKRNETFMDVLVDGLLFWRGLVLHNLYHKTDWYDSGGGTLKYRVAKIEAVDPIKYFWLNDADLSDYSYSEGMNLSTLLDNIFADIGFSAANVILDPNIGFDENAGTSYDIEDFLLYDMDSSMQVSTFLSHVINDLGAFIFNLDGKLYVTSRIGGSTVNINSDDIQELDKAQNVDYVDYIEVKATKDWSYLSDIGSHEHSHTAGSSANNSKNYSVDGTGFLDNIWIEPGGSNYFGSCGTTTPTDGDTDQLEDTSENFYSENIETGMIVEYNCAGGSPASFSPITDVLYDAILVLNIVYFITNTTVDTGKDYRIFREYTLAAATALSGVFKIEILCATAKDVYNEFFRTSPELLRVKLRDIDTYKDIRKKFVFDSTNHRVRKCSFDLLTDSFLAEMVEVS